MNKEPHNTFGVLARMLLLGAVVACPYAAQAAITEADFLDEMPVVLSVSRMSQPVNEAPAAVTVIDSDMIRASGFRDIPDLLRLVPGFSVAYTRDNTWAVGYHGMADAFSRRFQVLVDGRSFYSAAYGVVNWGELPLSIDDIERIEVVRGPNAATFGANAFFAVINIITKEAVQVPGTFASLQYGEQGMAGVTLRHGGGEGDLNYRLTFSAQNRDRFETDVVDGAASGKLFEESRTYFLNGRADYRLSATDELSAQFGASVGDWQAGRLYSPPRPDHFLEPRQQDVDAQYAQVKFRRALGVDDEWSLQFYHSRHNIDAPS
ncbi:MAG TPA: TonB-dependent receptor plug domain-containing protein, partial [Thiobacillus sp.]|nr:TonB-dependent receptor plug domain-containing protein [Thiobacillus sp.]